MNWKKVDVMNYLDLDKVSFLKIEKRGETFVVLAFSEGISHEIQICDTLNEAKCFIEGLIDYR